VGFDRRRLTCLRLPSPSLSSRGALPGWYRTPPADSPSPALRALLIVLTLHAGHPTALVVTAVVFALVTGGFAVMVPETER
jgi:hypothetical protein